MNYRFKLPGIAVVAMLLLASCANGEDEPTRAASIENSTATEENATTSSNAQDEPLEVLDGVEDAILIEDGYRFLEGPRWSSSENELYFSDVPQDKIFKGSTSGEIAETFAQQTNGLAFNQDNQLVVATQGGRSVARYNDSGQVETVTDNFEGKRYNSPNDLVLDNKGGFYFTDPPYGIEEQDTEIGCSGIYRIAVDDTVTQLDCTDISTRPNGIVLSPDGSKLYVAFSSAAKIEVWDVANDGSISNKQLFANTSASPDGMAVDTEGNLFVAAKDGVEVYNAAAEKQGVIGVPEQPANCTFGGPDGKTLYITARTGLYSTQVNIPGVL